MGAGERAELPGSQAQLRPGETWTRAPDLNPTITVTLVLRRAASDISGDLADEILSGHGPAMTRQEAAAKLGGDPQDFQTVRDFLNANGLGITSENIAGRTMHVEGTLADMERVFDVRLGYVTVSNSGTYLMPQGPITLPPQLAGIVTAVLGLDQRPAAKRTGA